MKRLSLLLVMIFIVCMSWATIDEYYSFNATTGTYTPITGTPVTDILSDDAISATVPLGFTFAYGDNAYTEIKLSSNGWIGLGSAQTGSNLSNALASTTIVPVIGPLWDDLSMASGTVQYLLSGTAPNRIFTIQYADVKWNWSGTNQFNFQVRLYETGKIDFIYGSATGTPNSASGSIGINMLPGGAGWFYSITPGSPATYSTTVENTSISAFPAQGTVYEFTPVVAQANDLAALSISGNTTPTVGTASPYTISVRNRGTAPQSTYAVKLFNSSNVELGSVAGTTIAPGAIVPFVINWTPTTAGPTTIYGKVVLAGDQNATNDQTQPLTVNVQASGTIAVTIGTGAETGRKPMDFYWKNSLYEYIIYPNEINLGGLITGIQFYNNFVSNLTAKPTKIWMGENTAADLAAGWIPSGQLTSVFDGNVNYPAGSNLINITFPTPYVYGGGNLVIMVNRPMDTEWFNASDNFLCQTIGTTRALYLYSDSTTFDPAAPAAATAIGQFPKTTLFFVVDGMGALNGNVTVSGQPLAGATVSVATTTHTTTTDATGHYSFPYIAQGTYAVTATKHGYTAVTNNVTIVEDQTATSNFALALLPQVTVTGRIVGSDAPTVGIAGATINLTGYDPYTATTNATGDFTITGVFASQTYQYTANATGYQPATGQAVVGTTNLNMGDITVNEMANPPFGVVAAENSTFTQVNLTWQAPGQGGAGITEGFEGTAFPPTDWTQVITDTGAAGTTGVLPTWCSLGTVALTPAVPPHGGTLQSGLWWSYNHQDEWLKTPQFVCPPSASLTFWSYVYLGSTNGDHYYVKISTDNGSTWTTLWDASTLTGGWNYYATAINIDLNAYAGQQVKLAWHALDPPSNDGLWYCWLIDDITVGSPTGVMSIATSELTTQSAVNTAAVRVTPNLPTSRAAVNNDRLQEPVLSVQNPSNVDRTLLGYKVWRLLAADQGTPANWTSLTPNPISATAFTDAAWGPLPSGVYKFAVRAIYTNNVMSTPAFSNQLDKGMMGTLTGTVTDFGSGTPVQGATVTAGDYSGTTNASGVYSFGVYQGVYTVTCAKTGYQTASQPAVTVTGLQTTTQNFQLTEITLPAGAVQAAVAGANVNITWMAPGTAGGEWIHYDSGENNDSIGTGGVADFDVAIRFPASALADYAGMSLHSLKVWPAQAGTFSLRVWTGGTATAPGTMVVDQAFTPTLDEYNTVALTTPVPITGNEELWFGYRCNVTSGYPAGCDAGPQTEGFGNMIYFNGAWSTLTALASSLTYNWNIQGYVGYSGPTQALTYVDPTAKNVHPEANTTMDRNLLGYKVWRLLQGQESNETAWTSLTPTTITATGWQDTGWAGVPDGMYRWAVKAIYTGNAMAPAAFSNAIQKQTQIGTIAGLVRNPQNQGIAGATVTCGTVTATTNASGAYSMTVGAGTVNVTAAANGYSAVTQTGIVVVTGQTTTVNFQLPVSQVVLNDGFETYADFAIDFAPWTNVDVDQSATYTMTNTTWPNAAAPQAFIIFNPATTTPPATTIIPQEGAKFAACVAATTPPNNDWLITPQVAGGGNIKFYAMSLTAQYGLERFKVGVSTTGTNPTNFTIISGASYIEAPTTWTEYTYSLAAYAGQQIRVGIQCLSNDAWIFMLDNVRIEGPSASDDPTVPVLTTNLAGNYPNPFNPETTIRYSVKDATPVTIGIYNMKGQLVKTLVNETKAAGDHTVVWNGTDASGRSVSSGMYYYKMYAGKYSSTKKMILMK